MKDVKIYHTTSHIDGKTRDFINVAMPKNSQRIEYEIYGDSGYKNIGRVNIIENTSPRHIFSIQCNHLYDADTIFFMKFNITTFSSEETEIVKFYTLKRETETTINQNISMHIKKNSPKVIYEEDVRELRESSESPNDSNNSTDDISSSCETDMFSTDKEVGTLNEKEEGLLESFEKQQSKVSNPLTNYFWSSDTKK